MSASRRAHTLPWYELPPAQRDRYAREKDRVTRPIYESVLISDPTQFHAVLMPGKHGYELRYLLKRGVPPDNIFVVEREPRIYKSLVARGLQSGPTPVDLARAIDYIHFARLDLIYFDLLGQLYEGSLIALLKLFKLKTMKPGSLLILTAGENQGEPFACTLNKCLLVPAGQAYVEAALRLAKHAPYQSIRTYRYTSTVGSTLKGSQLTRTKIHYTVTETWF